MFDGIINTAAQVEAPDEERIYGMVVAQVISNIDLTNQGRVQLHLPWLNSIDPWARVAVLMAGPDSGTYFIPQQGDEVLVAFNHGDVSDPFVVGSLWNGQDKPPAQESLDPVNKRMIRTPKGHTLVFDDLEQSITIKHATGGQVELTSDKIELSIGPASILLEQNGSITIKTEGTLNLDATTINISADAKLGLSGKTSASMDGGASCSINAASISIG